MKPTKINFDKRKEGILSNNLEVLSFQKVAGFGLLYDSLGEQFEKNEEKCLAKAALKNMLIK
jgi:hypothetical protein